MSPIEPLPPGYLLRELGYVDEIEAAASLDITPQTLAEYRKAGVGPKYTELARKILYSKQARAEWLANGGTRQADESLKGRTSAFPYTPPLESKINPPARPRAKRRAAADSDSFGLK
jgi:hypothetical protein